MRNRNTFDLMMGGDRFFAVLKCSQSSRRFQTCVCESLVKRLGFSFCTRPRALMVCLLDRWFYKLRNRISIQNYGAFSLVKNLHRDRTRCHRVTTGMFDWASTCRKRRSSAVDSLIRCFFSFLSRMHSVCFKSCTGTLVLQCTTAGILERTGSVM